MLWRVVCCDERCSLHLLLAKPWRLIALQNRRRRLTTRLERPARAKRVNPRQRSSLLLTSLTAQQIIEELNPNDVIMGRGAPIAFYEGNVRFRALVALHKSAYTSSSRHHPKQAVAERVLKEVHARGGRFVRGSRVSSSLVANSTATATTKVWVVISETAALEKVKQALRASDSTGHAVTESKTTGTVPVLSPLKSRDLAATGSSLVDPSLQGQTNAVSETSQASIKRSSDAITTRVQETTPQKQNKLNGNSTNEL